MTASSRAVTIIVTAERCQHIASQEGISTWRIGYGTTAGVRAGDEVTEPEARRLLDLDIRDASTTIRETVRVQLTQGQFDALSSWIADQGAAAWQVSSALRALNSGHYDTTIALLARTWRRRRWQQRGDKRRRNAEVEAWMSDNPEASDRPWPGRLR